MLYEIGLVPRTPGPIAGVVLLVTAPNMHVARRVADDWLRSTGISTLRRVP